MEIIETMTAAEATEWLRAHGMRISTQTLVRGIRSNAFPFGSVVPPEKEGEAPRTYVYTVLLEAWASARMRPADNGAGIANVHRC